MRHGLCDLPRKLPRAVQVESLALSRSLVIALQLALAIGDEPLCAAAVQALWNLVTPLLRLRQPSAFLLQPLCACLCAGACVPVRVRGCVRVVRVCGYVWCACAPREGTPSRT